MSPRPSSATRAAARECGASVSPACWSAASVVWYLPWLVAHLNVGALWLAVPFVLGSMVLGGEPAPSRSSTTGSAPARPSGSSTPGSELPVAVVIPTSHEAPEQVATTARSVLGQDWPQHRIRLIISDDAHSPDMRDLVTALSEEFEDATVRYHEPPERGDPEREGDAKAGNLNSACATSIATGRTSASSRSAMPTTRWSTRRSSVPASASCNTTRRRPTSRPIKEARVSRGDPFDNNQPHFYRGSMLARHAANAVFPCGSGLVWRREALADIGGFPSWNLVEDLQSGIEALRRGWRGVYLPILGAMAQHAPEDIPVTYKQRGTWALDTMRLVLLGRAAGTPPAPAAAVPRARPLLSPELCNAHLHGGADHRLRIRRVSRTGERWPLLAALLAVRGRAGALPGRADGGPVLRARVWRARQMWAGLAPVYAKACILALAGGPHRKPSYEVTRKHDEFRWYWRETLRADGLPAAPDRDAGLQPGYDFVGQQVRRRLRLLGDVLRDPPRRFRPEELVRARPAPRPGWGALLRLSSAKSRIDRKRRSARNGWPRQRLLARRDRCAVGQEHWRRRSRDGRGVAGGPRSRGPSRGSTRLGIAWPGGGGHGGACRGRERGAGSGGKRRAGAAPQAEHHGIRVRHRDHAHRTDRTGTRRSLPRSPADGRHRQRTRSAGGRGPQALRPVQLPGEARPRHSPGGDLAREPPALALQRSRPVDRRDRPAGGVGPELPAAPRSWRVEGVHGLAGAQPRGRLHRGGGLAR